MLSLDYTISYNLGNISLWDTGHSHVLYKMLSFKNRTTKVALAYWKILSLWMLSFTYQYIFHFSLFLVTYAKGPFVVDTAFGSALQKTCRFCSLKCLVIIASIISVRRDTVKPFFIVLVKQYCCVFGIWAVHINLEREDKNIHCFYMNWFPLVIYGLLSI